MIQSIVHIALVVKDYDEAIEFYTKKLHFTLVEDTYQPEQDKRWVVVAPPRLFRNHNSSGQSFKARARAFHWKSSRRQSLSLPRYR